MKPLGGYPQEIGDRVHADRAGHDQQDAHDEGQGAGERNVAPAVAAGQDDDDRSGHDGHGRRGGHLELVAKMP